MELERMNGATDEINKLEKELDVSLSINVICLNRCKSSQN